MLFILLVLASINLMAQKKPLDHSVYDSWQNLGERAISKNGLFILFSINEQEGDNILKVQQLNGNLIEIPRAYAAQFTGDSKYVIAKIKPTFQETREAKIKKKAADEMPKDSLVILNLLDWSIVKVADVKSFKLAEDSNNWLAFQLGKAQANGSNNSGRAAGGAPTTGAGGRRPGAAGNTLGGPDEGSTLILQNLVSNKIDSIKNVTEYVFNKKGTLLVVDIAANKKDSTKESVQVLDLNNHQFKTIHKNYTDAKGFTWDEDGNQLGFVVTTDSTKAVQKYFELFYYKLGNEVAEKLADKNTIGVNKNWTISENGNISFSKSGKRLFFGTSIVLPPKDTTLPEFDRVQVDVWHYNDDDLQPAQLKNLNTDVNRSYLATWNWDKKEVVQLANEKMRSVTITAEGDGNYFYANTDYEKRVARQWQGFALTDVYSVNPLNGETELISKDFKGNVMPSYEGKYLLLADERKQQVLSYNAENKKITRIASDISSSLFDEENDVPDDPNPYGVAKWHKNDQYVYLYDRYDMWQVDPSGKEKSSNITNGKKDRRQFRLVNVNTDEKVIDENSNVVFRTFNENNKNSGIAKLLMSSKSIPAILFNEPKNVGFSIQKAENADVLMYSKESYVESPNIFTIGNDVSSNLKQTKWSNINPQQQQYNWGTAELFKWKAYTGKMTEGILYKPENFDPKKKYPMISYFYERNNQTLNNYQAPSPTPSRLNISFFVSRGYIVFVPDIWYKKGYPGQAAYDYILSGTRAVVKLGFVDSTKLGLQGQSWGGYQTAQLITMTHLYAAAWAGAPVGNMFSAYGGIRWESGLNRQFQYEKSQSRIGATIWERPDLYTLNSPIFHLKKNKTPMVIMSNDADGAVPWYQGIELFTNMRRLGQKVWLLNYNGEAHNLVERRNRKDIQIREQQFFDWLLKGEKPAKWLSVGVPAVMKGRDWGLGADK